MIPFTAFTATKTPNASQWAGLLPKITPSRKGSQPPSNTWFLGPTWVIAKRHFDRFSRFCTAYPCDQRTHRQKDHAICNICNNRPRLCTVCRDAA